MSRLAFLAVLLAAPPAAARVWTDFTGLHHTEAELVSIRDEAVVLRKADGQELRLPFDKLSHEDVAYLKDYIHKHPRQGAPPEALKSDEEKAADAVNAVLRKMQTQLDAAAEEKTEVRQRAAYANVLKTLDSEIKNTVFEVYFPIENVADDSTHTLTLGKPEMIEGYKMWMNRFQPKLPANKALNIKPGDALVLKGHGRLAYASTSNQLLKGDKLSLQCVAVTYNATSRQYYGLMLVDYKFRIEERLTVESPRPVEPPEVPAAPVPVFGQPSVAANPPPPAPPAVFGDMSARPATTTTAAPPAPAVPSGFPDPAVLPTNAPLSRIDTATSYAKYVASQLTPDKFDRRVARMREHYRDYAEMNAAPRIDIGHNYHTVFWRSLPRWSNDRLARWAYHNQDNIGLEFWKQIAHRSGVDTEMDRLRKDGVKVDPNYIDAEFVDDPDLMYSDEFVSAIYSASTYETAGNWMGSWSTMVVVCLVGGLIIIAWSKYEGWI